MKFARHIFKSNTRSKFLTYPDNIERKVAEGIDSHNNHQHLDQLKQRSRVNIQKECALPSVSTLTSAFSSQSWPQSEPEVKTIFSMNIMRRRRKGMEHFKAKCWIKINKMECDILFLNVALWHLQVRLSDPVIKLLIFPLKHLRMFTKTNVMYTFSSSSRFSMSC